MELEVEAKKLVDYINSLGLEIPERQPSHQHVGALIVDAVLQVGHKYETQVAGRVAHLRTKYPQAATVLGFLHLLQTVGAQELLNGWKGQQEHKRLSDHAKFFAGKGINTFDELAIWLQDEKNRDSLIKAGLGIRDKTADYYRVLVRLPDAVKVDSRVEEFISASGIDIRKYEYKELRSIVQLAARQLKEKPIDLEGAIWKYQGRGNELESKGKGEKMKTEQHKNRILLNQGEINSRIDVIEDKSIRTLCFASLGLLQRHGCFAVHCREDNISVYDHNVLNHNKEGFLMRFCPRKTRNYFVVRYILQNNDYNSKNISKKEDFDNILDDLRSWGRITW